jgi:hypothetical protein
MKRLIEEMMDVDANIYSADSLGSKQRGKELRLGAA